MEHEQESGITKATTTLLLVLILIVGATLLINKINAPFDGYLAYNEAWYSLIIENYNTHSWLNPIAIPGQPDLRIPPFFTYIGYLFFLILGDHEWVYRILPILCGLMCIGLTFTIAKRLYGPRTGITAAALLAVSPVFALTARNVQTDSMYLMLCLAGLHFYLAWKENNNPGTLVFSAIMFGLGLFTKQFTAVALASVVAAEMIYRLKNRDDNSKVSGALIAVCLFIVFIIPGHYYIYHLIRHPEGLFVGQRYGAASLAEIPGFAALRTLAAEMFFGIGPIAILLALGAVMIPSSRKRAAFDPFTTVPLVFFIIFFMIFHKHTYYMLPIVPYLCILAGKHTLSFRNRSTTAILVAVSLAAGFTHSCMVLGAIKHGYARFNSVCEKTALAKGEKILVVDGNIMSRFEPALYYYCTSINEIKIENKDQWLKQAKNGFVDRDYGRLKFFFLDTQFDTKKHDDSQFTAYFSKRILGPYIFGYVPYYIPFEKGGTMRTFVPGNIGVKRMRTGTFFEMKEVADIPSLQLTELPDGYGVHGNGVSKDSPLYFSPLPAYKHEIDE